ncbi:hypothetical protein PMZ80_009359 [Knufia obscura]|uniref:Uncharacterized protein n=1 Tax=Knufia obscura TaxID=1635080 RepID=A0ABR0RDV0_9EURO|nr:hypothetical protein PMZ80_009359 [Knufia obscura]
MKLSASVSLLLPTIISANVVWQPQITPMPMPMPTPTNPTPSEQIAQIPTITSTPSTFTTSSGSQAWGPIISGASHLLDELDEHLHIDLRKRQGNIAATNVAPATQPTQMSPVTLYDMGDGKQIPFTQLFVAVLEQWASPSAGTIGLGTIQGEIGVVKTKDKRDAIPEPTATPGQIFTIRGREVTMP